MDVQHDDARAWLSRIDALQRPCDVDVLLFFASHRRTLMALAHLAPLLGCEIGDVAAGLERLHRAGFVTQVAPATRRYRLFVCAPGGAEDQQLKEFVAFASERGGRLALRRALTPITEQHAGNAPTAAGDGSDRAAS